MWYKFPRTKLVWPNDRHAEGTPQIWFESILSLFILFILSYICALLLCNFLSLMLFFSSLSIFYFSRGKHFSGIIEPLSSINTCPSDYLNWMQFHIRPVISWEDWASNGSTESISWELRWKVSRKWRFLKLQTDPADLKPDFAILDLIMNSL